MNGHDKNIPYSTSDIQKYLRGELSAPDMHRLELAALEDPFLSDALEGMDIHRSLPSSPSFNQDLGELQKRLDKRVGKKDRKGVIRLVRSPWKVAAALILLTGLGLTAYFTFLNTTHSTNLLSRTEQKSPPALPAASDTVTRKEPAEAPKEADRSREPATMPSTRPSAMPYASSDAAQARTDSESYTSHERKSLSRGRIPPDFMRSETDTNLRKSSIDQDSVGKRKDMIDKDNLALLDKPSSTASAMEKVFKKTDGLKITAVPDQVVFTGKVTDQHNNPLPGVSLRLKDNYSFGTVTDQYGSFNLSLPQKDSAMQLTVASVGYEQASLDLSPENLTGNIIQLKPRNNALNEVVVTGYGAQRKEILRDNSKPGKTFVTKKAAPAAGWPAYQSYLDLHKKAINSDSTFKGDLVISFLVGKEGILSSFKVEQSLSPDADAAAIRLIQEGPSWKLLNRKKARAWVTISF